MKKLSKNNQKPSLPVLKKLIGLSVSGLTLLAALAWNNTIQEITNNFIKKLRRSRCWYYFFFALCSFFSDIIFYYRKTISWSFGQYRKRAGE